MSCLIYHTPGRGSTAADSEIPSERPKKELADGKSLSAYARAAGTFHPKARKQDSRMEFSSQPMLAPPGLFIRKPENRPRGWNFPFSLCSRRRDFSSESPKTGLTDGIFLLGRIFRAFREMSAQFLQKSVVNLYPTCGIVKLWRGSLMGENPAVRTKRL